MRIPLLATVLFIALFAASCKLNHKESLFAFETIDPAFRALVSSSAEGKVIAAGFEWTEGPLWVESEKMLLFCDVPKNIIYKWTEAGGKQTYLQPSGYTGTIKRGGEVGSNGLTLDLEGRLLLCQQGDRRIARMNTALNAPSASYTTLANNYGGKKFDSPNDVVVAANGNIFFTDPPYGLERNVDDSLKEAPYQGVYKISPAGEVTLLTASITRPNGLALMPGGKTLIVASSDAGKAVWYAFDLNANDSLINGRIFCDATANAAEGTGLPDGLKIDRAGNIFATGPGGIWVFDKTFKLIGKIHIAGLTSNCAFANDERTLYITADDKVLRLDMR